MSNLIKYNAIVADEWTRVTPPTLGEETVRKQAGKVVLFKLTGEETFSAEQIAATQIPAGKVLVPFAVWRTNKDALASRVSQGEVGLLIATHEAIEDVITEVKDINAFALVAVYVERFADGRIFTIGNLLRTRYGFKNELRAVGDVLRDQLFFLKRSGFNSYLIRADRSATEALASLKDFSEPYQGAVDIAQPAWRRTNR
ncbi:DUF934 domain-containing protein [Candidatus Methylopumilus turicensis]|uniref:Oxidoreductase probably involved in sulfite reduction n=1 Tax=Candidatus Methylopumilus turicensis TaxID=1581680 RepID=A0A0B7IU79_9PROT|nr:DUF934 domain-containing protein [Candidatus Methylopumilus turicensis]CEN55809.1 conserved protein of unknown function [Candidatus Methylopumilus turicensis]